MGLYRILINLVDITALPKRPLGQRSWLFLRQIAWDLRHVLLPIIFLNIAIGILFGFMPYFWKRVVDLLSTPLNGTELTNALLWPVVLYIVFGLILPQLLRHITYFLQGATIDTSVVHRLTRQLYHYQLGQSLSTIQNELSGRLASKVNSIAERARVLLGTLVEDGLRSPVMLVTSLATLLFVSPWLAMPLILWVIPFIYLNIRFLPRLNKISQQAADARSTTFGRIVDTLSNMTLVKLFSHSGREDAKILETITAARDIDIKSKMGWVGFLALCDILDILLTICTLLLVLWLRIEGRISTGDVVMAMTLIATVSNAVAAAARNLSSVLENLAVLNENLAIVTQPYSVVDAPNAITLPVVKGEITFDQVSFAYNKASAKPVINNLSIHIPAGQKVGLIGLSGAGKSTLLNLLLRFYDVDAGRITIDGYDIAAITQESLRAQIAVVAQDTSLLHRSIADNIRYGRNGASDAEVEAAAKAAEAHDFIMGINETNTNHSTSARAFYRLHGRWRKSTEAAETTMRHGYEAFVGERGVKLSGGQRQRIALARLILKDAPILLFDEATSALDSEVEQAIQENLERIMSGRTVIAIAHRLSTIAKLDRLLVLENGQIVEDGTHAELLKRDGRYATLWKRQSGGFLAE